MCCADGMIMEGEVKHRRKQSGDKKQCEAQDKTQGGDQDKKLKNSYLIIATSYAHYVLVALAALLCYSNSLSGDFVHDDVMAIVKNEDVWGQNCAVTGALWSHDYWGQDIARNTSHKSYRPLTVLTFRLNFCAHGLSPRGFHAVNVLLHALVSVLFTHLCVSSVFPGRVQAATLAGLVFAVHPIHTEAVSGIVGRADLLAAMIYLLTLLSFMRSSGRRFSSDSVWKLFALSSLALLAKETGATVLLVCFFYELFSHQHIIYSYLFLQKHRLKGVHSLFLRCSVIVAMACVLLLSRVWVNGGSVPQFVHEDNPAAFAHSLQTRVLSRLHIYAYNVWLLLCPSALSYDWQMGSLALVTRWRDFRNAASVLVTGALVLMSGKCVTGRKPSKSGTSVFLGVVLLVIPFLPAANIFATVGFVIAERILYIPSMGMIILFTHAVEYLRQQCRGVLVLAMLLCAVFAAKTIDRNRDWHNRETLFRSGLRTLPHNAKMHYNYANFLKDSGQNELAVKYYRETLRLWPAHASAHNNLGTLLLDPVESEYHYRQALIINPLHANAHFNLGNLLHTQGSSDLGISSLHTAYRLDPGCSMCLLNIAAILVHLDRPQQAHAYFLQAIRNHPHDATARNNYAVFLEQQGDKEAALKLLSDVYTKDPSHVVSLQNAARILNHAGRIEEARDLYTRISTLPMTSLEALEQTGVFFYNHGEIGRARSVFLRAVLLDSSSWRHRLHYVQALYAARHYGDAADTLRAFLIQRPGHVDARKHLANVLGEMQQHEEAIVHLQEAIHLTDDEAVVAELHLSLGKHYRDLERMDEALDNYQLAAQTRPQLAEAKHSLGVIYHIKGNFTQAKQYYTEASQLEPGNQLLKRNIEKLNQAMLRNTLLAHAHP